MTTTARCAMASSPSRLAALSRSLRVLNRENIRTSSLLRCKLEASPPVTATVMQALVRAPALSGLLPAPVVREISLVVELEFAVEEEIADQLHRFVGVVVGIDPAFPVGIPAGFHREFIDADVADFHAVPFRLEADFHVGQELLE